MRQYIVVDEAELVEPSLHAESGFYVYEVDRSAVLVETPSDEDFPTSVIVSLAHDGVTRDLGSGYTAEALFPRNQASAGSGLSEGQAEEITRKYAAQIATAWPGTVQNVLRNMLIEVADRTS